MKIYGVAYSLPLQQCNEDELVVYISCSRGYVCVCVRIRVCVCVCGGEPHIRVCAQWSWLRAHHTCTHKFFCQIVWCCVTVCVFEWIYIYNDGNSFPGVYLRNRNFFIELKGINLEEWMQIVYSKYFPSLHIFPIFRAIYGFRVFLFSCCLLLMACGTHLSNFWIIPFFLKR